jgi:SOS response regulatory protein OraA/RecX
MRKNILVTVAILVLALILSLATAVAAFADTSGQSSSSGSGFQNRMQDEYIQALATASNQTADQINQDVTNGQTVAQIAQQLAQAGTITQQSLTDAIQQELASEDQTRATNMAQALISGQMPGGQGNSGQSGNTQSGRWQNGGQGAGQGDNMIIQALASASGQTAEIQQDVTNGQTPAQIAQQLAQAGTITQQSLAAAIQQVMASNEQQKASTDAQALISGQMPGRQGGTQGGTSTSNTTTGGGIVLKIGSSRMSVNGVDQDIDPGYSTQPVIVNSSTFVPIKAIIAALGGTVDWSAADKQVTINLNNSSIVLSIGSKSATVNGVEKTLDNTPFISATNRTMLPLRFITENLGGHTVNWDSTTRSITIQ